MRSAWTIAVALFALLTCAFVGAWIVTDRARVMRSVGERTQSLARMIAAHADAAINDANMVISSEADLVAGWDFRDEQVGREIFNRLRVGTSKSPYASAAWIVDGAGIGRVNSWEYPSTPYQNAGRVYYNEHVAGAPNPLIASDPKPGVVSGQERFTYSEALRNPDGTVRAIIVVAIYSSVFDTLYKEAANWPHARAGLYNGRGDPLGRLRPDVPASPAFITKVNQNIAEAATGHALVGDGKDVRIVGWQRSDAYPGLYATASQTVSAALRDWKKRSFLLAGFASSGVVGFALFAWMSARAADARHAAALSDLAMREAHHRVKNSLQLMASMVGLQSRSAGDAHTRAALEKIGHQIAAIADAHDLLQKTATVGQIDINALLRQLCRSLQLGYAGTIRFSGGDGPHIDGSHAASIAVIGNEIITNALKHAHSVVDVSCEVNGATLTVTVADDGPGLPADFRMAQKHGFGLRASLLLAEGLHAQLTAANRADANGDKYDGKQGAVFCLLVPIPANRRASAAHSSAAHPGPHPDRASPLGADPGSASPARHSHRETVEARADRVEL